MGHGGVGAAFCGGRYTEKTFRNNKEPAEPAPFGVRRRDRGGPIVHGACQLFPDTLMGEKALGEGSGSKGWLLAILAGV